MIKKFLGLFFLLINLPFNYAYSADTSIDEETILSCLPEKYCTIKKIHKNPTSKKWIIYVQDAHTNYDAQANINNILKSLNSQNYLDVVLIEGASDLIDTSPITTYPFDESKKIVSDYLMQTSVITGFEYFSINSDMDVELFGVEQPEIYIKNLAALRNGITLFQKNSVILDKISSFLDSRKAALTSPELKQYLELKKLYSGNIIDVKEYCGKLAEKISLDKNKYPNIYNINLIKKISENINYGILEKEIQESIKFLFTVLEKDKIVEFNQLNLKHKIGSVTARTFYNQVIELLNENERLPNLFSTLKNYSNLLNLYSRLDHTELLAEIDKAEKKFIATYASTANEKAIFSLENKMKLLSEILSFKISRKKVTDYFAHTNEYTIENFAELINSISPKQNNLLISDIKILLDNLNNVSAFYSLALKRDSILVDNSLKKLADTDLSFGVLIAGGFHTEGILENLEKSNINYIFVTPAIEHISKKNIYISRILKINSPLDSFFENALNSLAIPRWLAKVPIGISKSEQQIQILKSITLLLTVHTDFIALETPNITVRNILYKINEAIANYDSRGIFIKNIKLFPEYRIYEVSVKGNSLFYCFKNRQNLNSEQFGDLLEQDMRSIIARNISLGESTLSILTKDTLSLKLSQLSLAQSQLEQGDDTDIINWAKKHIAETAEENDLIKLNSLPRSIITLSLRGSYYHIAHIQFTGDERVSEVLYHDKINAYSIKPQYLWYLIQVLQESIKETASLLPNIIINNNDYTAIVPVENQSDFITQVNFLMKQEQSVDGQQTGTAASSPSTEDPLKLNYVTFTSSIEDDESVSDEQLTEKLKLFIRDTGPEERLFHIAQTSPNKRVLNLLADEKFYKNSGINKASEEELYILKGLLKNPKTPKDAIDKILKRPYLLILSFRDKNDTEKTDFLNLLTSHKSITSNQLQQIAKILITLKKDILNDDYIKYKHYESTSEAPIWSDRKESNISQINGYLESIINNSQTNTQTIEFIKNNLAENTMDTNVYFSIARYSNTPSIIFNEIKNGAYPAYLNGWIDYLLTALAENPTINMPIVNYLIETNKQEVILQLTNTLINNELPNITEDELIKTILKIMDNNPSAHILRTLAGNPVYLSKEIYDKLIDDYSPATNSNKKEDDFQDNIKMFVLKALASNKNLSMTQITKLYNLENTEIMMSLFSNPSMNFTSFRTDKTLKFLEKMKGDIYAVSTFIDMAKNPNPLPEEIENFLSESDSFAVRAALAERFHLSSQTIKILADDPHPFVRGMIAKNQSVPVSLLEKFYENYDDEIVIDHTTRSELMKINNPLFNKNYVDELFENNTKILDMLSLNNAIFKSPLKIVKPMMQDSRFSQNVITVLERAKTIAMAKYNAGNYTEAYRILGYLALQHDYAPFGSTFAYGNATYKFAQTIKNDRPLIAEKLTEHAKESYNLSYSQLNNINALMALEYIERTGEVPDVMLDAPNYVQFILQNFHSAQPLGKENFTAIDRFLNFPWEKFDYSGDIATVLALTTHILYDCVSQRIISSETGLSILTQFLYKDSTSFTPVKWHDIKSNIIKQIINESTLDQTKKDELLNTPFDLAEFYLRKGQKGIISRQSYESFQNSLFLDNVPPYLRDDVTKSLWLELNDLTQDLLFVEPHFFTLVRLITDNGDFLNYADRLRFSMNFAKDNLQDGIGDINSVIKSELGHAISYGTSLGYDHYIRNSAFEEFQDRSACLKFPREFEDAEQSNEITKLYAKHDNLLIEFYKTTLKQIDPFIMMEKLQELKLFNINEEYYIKNGLNVINKLLSKPITALEERYLGEAIFVLASHDKSFASQANEIQSLFNQIKKLKKDIQKLPWDVKVFFAGGTYVQTYMQPFGQLMPPVEPITGDLLGQKLESAEIHFSGEWLNYLYRMRIRELLRSNELSHNMLPAFYRSAPIYLNSLIYNPARYDKITPNLKYIAGIIVAITAQDVFDTIKNRAIKETIIPSNVSASQTGSKKPIQLKTEISQNTAKPEKIILKLTGQVLQRLYSQNILTFAQFTAIYTKYFNEVYSLQENQALINLNSRTQLTKKFLEHFILSMAGIDIDLPKTADFLLGQPEIRENINKQDQYKFPSYSNGQTLTLIDSETLSPLLQSPISNAHKLRQKIMVIDFDEILNSDNPATRMEMLNALKYNLMLQNEDIKNHLKLLLFSSTKTNEQINNILQNFFSENQIKKFKIVSQRELEKQRLPITKYIETQYAIAKQNILFITSEKSGLNDQFLSNGAISFEIPKDTTNWFANVFRTFSVAFDFAENERLPQSMRISKIMQNNPNYYYFSFANNANATFKQFYSGLTTGSAKFSLTDLSGISFVIPNNKGKQPTVLRKNIVGYDLIEQAL